MSAKKRPRDRAEDFPTPTGGSAAPAPAATTKKKSRRGDATALGETTHEARYSHTTLSHNGEGSYLRGSLARDDPQQDWRARSGKARAASEASWDEYHLAMYLASEGGEAPSWEKDARVPSLSAC